MKVKNPKEVVTLPFITGFLFVPIWLLSRFFADVDNVVLTIVNNQN